MGLGPIQAIYHARFIRYLENRGLKQSTGGKVWAFLGDGEMDEPESLGSITLASRENLDNLIFVVNCNLQRLDGPVRGNGKIIQELEAIFRGAGWNVIKVIWGSDWDSLIRNDRDGLLVKRMGEDQRRAVSEILCREWRVFPAEPVWHGPAPAENGGTPIRRATGADAAGRTRSDQGACGLPGSGGSYRFADDHFGENHQGLWAGRGGRRQEHYPPAEKAE